MRILVYGAGAVGGYVGGRLAQAGHQVTLIVRDVTAESIDAKGLIIQENGQSVLAQPATTTSVAQTFLSPDIQFDLIIMGMKAYDLKTAIDHLVAFCPDPPPILTLQNGIGVERPLLDQFGPQRLIIGALTTPVSKPMSNQIVVERSDRGLGIAPAKLGQPISQWVNLFRQSGVTTEAYKDYESMKWSKALLNIVANATSAILNRPPGVVYKSEAMFDLEVRMLRETLAVMDALNLEVVDLPGSSARRLAFGVQKAPRLVLKPILTGIVAKGRGDKMPSFQIDLMAGKGQSEVIFHNGAIAKIGLAHNIPTPVNTALTDVLLRLARHELDWRDFDGKPGRLLAEVARFEKS
ncbi:MAG: ketopantoate reductase family protein [Ardenticatenaceae bacterium]|nr:ketopantoate reductase family protein [Anaerolineales bacterium]MCB8983713.1 ketopantoate reductase family protein [Ardenticatenaceae bacterium]MCB8987430.1 ketopantoate reductase family protein [Ardenticatenaceae bacterium]